jgi:hypothetical protein
MLLILEFPAFIIGAICVVVGSLAVSFSFLQFAIVKITKGVNHTTSSVCFVLLSVALIKISIDPTLDTPAFVVVFFAAVTVVLSFILK